MEHSFELFLCIWLQAGCDSADTQCLGAVGVDVEAVIAQALVHTIQVQVDVLETTQYTTLEALSVCLVFTRWRIEVLVEMVHFGVFPPVALNAKEGLGSLHAGTRFFGLNSRRPPSADSYPQFQLW